MNFRALYGCLVRLFSFYPRPVLVPVPVRSSARSRGGFTLVEVTMAIGIVSFAFVGIFALLPAGLGVFRHAMDTSIGAQIAQRIVGEIEQTDFDSLVPSATSSPTGVTKDTTGNFYLLPYRYFDDQGIEVLYDTATAVERSRIIYNVRVRGSMPGSADPAQANAANFTSLPATTAVRYHPRNVTFLAVQVVNNPAHLPTSKLDTIASQNALTPALISPAVAKANHLTVQTYSAVVARNGFLKPL